jgi:hypothetical protein
MSGGSLLLREMEIRWVDRHVTASLALPSNQPFGGWSTVVPIHLCFFKKTNVRLRTMSILPYLRILLDMMT